MELIVTLFSIFVVGPALFIGVYWLLFNNSKGERYLKYRTQGPFAPLPQEGENEARKAGVKDGLDQPRA
jgi:hypothetical protein